MRELLADFSQDGVIIGFLVMTDRSPIHGFRSAGRIQVLVDDIAVQSFGVRPFFMNKRDTTQRHLQLRGKLFFGKVSFDTKTLNSGAIKENDGRRPQDIETMEVRRRLFDVDGNGQEILIDETAWLFIGVRLGFQPNACASSWRGAKVEQNWFATVLCLTQRRIRVFDPLHWHSPSSFDQEILRLCENGCKNGRPCEGRSFRHPGFLAIVRVLECLTGRSAKRSPSIC